MARLRSAKRSNSPLLTEDVGKAPARVTHAAEVADREERKKLLSAILRDGKATGAEAVAAARLLEAMERNSANGQVAGIPPPTSRPEQVQRVVRLLTMAGRKITAEALDIIASRSEAARTAKFQAAFDNNMPLNPHEIAEWKRRTKMEETDGTKRSGASKRFRPDSSGTTSPESGGVSELYEATASLGASADEDESDGIGDAESGEEVGGEQ